MSSGFRRCISSTFWFLLSAGTAAALPLPAAVPRPASDPPRAQSVRRFDIAPGPLLATIAAFETLTGAKVLLPDGLPIEAFDSPGVSGTHTADQALERLLQGTGLTFLLTGPNTYGLEIIPVSETVEVRAHLPYRPDATATATRTLTPLRDVPQALTVVTQAAIADQRMQSMADVVRYAPGVGMAQGEGNRDTPILRGNSTTADFYVDGIRDDVQYFRDLYNVDRIEVLKGPNAMIFGRGGAGGVINRATRQADWNRAREVTIQGGSHTNRRGSFDVNHPINGRIAARLAAMYENSDSYRARVRLERYGINPTVAFLVGSSTTIRAGFEHFRDERTADRGIPSHGPSPVTTGVDTFFGDPAQSTAYATVNAVTSAIDHPLGSGVLLRNRTRFASYDKFYQNVYPSAVVSADGRTATLSAYNNATTRANVFNQTDVSAKLAQGRVVHLLLAGAEFGRQGTTNFRNTGYFSSLGPNVTSFPVPVSAPTVSVPVAFRQSATDADNDGVATVAAAFAQDQLELAPWLRAVVGLRFDRFHVDFHNRRANADVMSTDNLLSPRAGVIVKPVEAVSLYSSYSMAYVPRAGEQLSSLTLSNQALEPEQFTNYELGAKWDVTPGVSATAAAYRLTRRNVAIPDPLDPTRSVLVDGQRTKGLELAVSGSVAPRWSVIGGYAFQDGVLTATQSPSAKAGAKLAQLPAHSFSLWNRYDVSTRWGVGAGIIHSDETFTSTDNTVVLPAFTRVDAACFLNLTRALRAQVNVENLFDEHYYAFANGNNNITPAAPRSIKFAMTTRF
jgi:catecholate siderophore receptor